MATFKFDRKAFAIQTFEESDKTTEYWRSKTPKERFEAAYYLICQAYNIDPENPPRIDKTVFSMRKHDK
jgi:uncharacterized protein (UPF0262 family)